MRDYLRGGIHGIAYHSFVYGGLSVIGLAILPFLKLSESFRQFFTSYCLPLLASIMLFLSGTRVRVEGIENLERLKHTSYILIANHVTTLDISILTKGLKLRDVRCVYDGDVFRSVPIVGNHACRVFRGLGWFEIAGRDLLALRKLVQDIRKQMMRGEKIKIMIFPEGTRSWQGKVNDFQQGAFYLACLLRVPVVPVVMRGVYKCHKPASLCVYPGHVGISVLPSLPAAKEGDDVRQWTRKTRDQAQRIYHKIETLNISSQ